MGTNIFFDDNSTVLIDIMEEFLGPLRKSHTSKHEYCFDCPECSLEKGFYQTGDGKGNLSVNFKLGKYHCWACSESHDTKGLLFKLFKKYANNDSYRKFKNLKLTFYADEYNTEEIVVKPDIALPEGSIKLAGLNGKSYTKDAYKYLKMRGIGDDLIAKHNLHYGGEGYDYRIVLPSYDIDENLNFYLGRSILKKPFLKYKNLQVPKEDIIFNEHLIDWNKTIFIVEGGFDHIPLPNSIPLLGKVLHDKLFIDIYYKARNHVVIALDPDARDDTRKMFNKLDAGRLAGRVWYIDLPDGQDISKINELYGFEGLKQYVTRWKQFKE